MPASKKPTVTFETSTLADAVGKAARVAPSKGEAFDKSAGVLLTTDPDSPDEAIIRATDLQCWYSETVGALKIWNEGKIEWRLPAALFAGITGNLPIGSGVKVTLTEINPGQVEIKSGKSRARIPTIVDSFPTFPEFDETGMLDAHDLSAKMKQVAWACDKAAIPLVGIHINGERLIATDRYQLALIPCQVPVVEPITVPLGTVAPVIKSSVETQIKAEERRLLLMPDPYTRISSTIFDVDYPQVDRVLRDDFTIEATIRREALLAAISRMMVLVKTERYPRLTLTFGEGSLHLHMSVDESGEMEDELEITGGDKFRIHFTPQYLLHALEATAQPEVTFYIGPDPHRLNRITDGTGYEAWVMPRKEAD